MLKKFCAITILLLVALPAVGQNSTGALSTGALQDFLRKQIRLSDSEMAAMERGEVVGKLLNTDEKNEVAAFGVVRLNVPRETFIERFRDIVNFKKSESVLQIGKFSSPPRLEDLNGLTFDKDDLDTIKRCEVGNCDIKLSVKTIERFRKEINWSAPDYSERANALAKQMLLGYVNAYLAGGDSVLVEYHDKKNAVRLADEFHAVVRQSPYLFDYVPEFYRYLTDFPKAQLPNVENFIYWSKEKFGLKPVVSITHVTIYKIVRGSNTDLLISSKQLYASHYFEASLGLTAFVNADGGSAKPGSYLIYLNRSRADALQGGFSGVKRSIIGGRIRDGLKRNLLLTRQKLEGGSSR